MAAGRRIGTPGSETYIRLLDAAEHLLLEEGYAAVTSRRVAGRADLKPQLVHYYFRTMDDLFLAVYRRRAEQNLERYSRALDSDRPLRALWQLSADPSTAAFTAEFLALANHRKTIREEIARSAERFRQTQLHAFASALARHGVAADQLPPVVALLAMTGLSQILALEGALGITSGHDVTVAYVENLLRDLEDGSLRSR